MHDAFTYRLPVSYFLKVQGIPVIFGDGCHPGTSDEFSPCLRIKHEAISSEITRWQPIGGGRAITATLDADTLKASGKYQQLFSFPNAITHINSDSITTTQSTIPVVDTGDFPSSGTAYWGHEKLVYAGKSSAGLTGVTRDNTSADAKFNYPHKSLKGSTGLWSMVSDRPLLWTGRLVELWGVVSNPEGELLAAPFASSPTTGAARVFVGYISEQPLLTSTGIDLRILPAERRADVDYGWAQSWLTDFRLHEVYGNQLEKVYWPKNGKLKLSVYLNQGEASTITEDGTTYDTWTDDFQYYSSEYEPHSSVAESSADRISTAHVLFEDAIDFWLTDIKSQIPSGYLAKTNLEITKTVVKDSLVLTCRVVGAKPWQDTMTMQITCTGPAKPLEPVVIGATESGEKPDLIQEGWISQLINVGFVKISPGVGSSPLAYGGIPIMLPEQSADTVFGGAPQVGQGLSWQQSSDSGTGTGFCEIKEVFELNTASDPINQRFWVRVENVKFVAGGEDFRTVQELKECLFIQETTAAGLTAGDIWTRMLVSSGTGTRGTQDLNPFGWGAGIPQFWLDFAKTDFGQFDELEQRVYYDNLDPESIFIDSIPIGIAFSQRFNKTSGLSKIGAAEYIAPSGSDTVITITTSQISSEPVEVEVLEAPPNVIELEFVGSEMPPLIFRDMLRISAEGSTNVKKLQVPSWWVKGSSSQNHVDMLSPAAMLFESMIQGPYVGNVYVYNVGVIASVLWSINTGDVVEFSGTHYAWADLNATTGQHRAASIKGRVLGVTRPLSGDSGSVRVAVWPQLQGNYYCPDSKITAVDSGNKLITLTAGTVPWFWKGDEDYVAFYRPGSEGSFYVEAQLDDGNDGANQLLLKTWPTGLAVGDHITFASTDAASARQKQFAHVDDKGILL